VEESDQVLIRYGGGVQMVAQAYPFVASKVLRRDTAGGAALLREIVFDPATGAVRPARLAALLNAALGFVAQGNAEGFVDLDAVPAEGASVQVRACAPASCQACVAAYQYAKPAPNH
jgi:hypothetical protein